MTIPKDIPPIIGQLPARGTTNDTPAQTGLADRLSATNTSKAASIWVQEDKARAAKILPRTHTLDETPLDSVVIVPFVTTSGFRVLVTAAGTAN